MRKEAPRCQIVSSGLTVRGNSAKLQMIVERDSGQQLAAKIADLYKGNANLKNGAASCKRDTYNRSNLIK